MTTPDQYALTPEELAFLRALPTDGRPTPIVGSWDVAERLHVRGFVFMSRGAWPQMDVAITFEGRKALARNAGTP